MSEGKKEGMRLQKEYGDVLDKKKVLLRFSIVI